MIIYGVSKSGRIHRNVQREYVRDAEEETKTCRACKRTMPVSEFLPDRRSGDGFSMLCEVCIETRKNVSGW